ncbi:NhaP-type Na+(K+)/H+ antiporter [Desulfocapsa sulfexigens DSM 10523]|uniref:NhaP-type Na+(K+)/H+ antiporter n=1 Tax=Desulfocapsa sulfexigens (strain DSM 10523 / SB164P1) TaxID=1167006 RepID=M1PAT6_DESSD|nr:sodium:proton antiporter [Desulfocapsa sulfexigens]AGF78767.1 NhaP-type Na+(K+)/H+ antiporter [Desulfocapsa sulfexigens DSM 10523]
MQLFHIIAILISLAAAFSWVNYRFLRMPTAIGLMTIALVMSLVLIGLAKFGYGTIGQEVERMLTSIDFNATLLHGMLSFLLFAGALHINLEDLAKQRLVIAILATASVIGATFLIGIGAWYISALLDLNIPMIYCLLFGSLISPTDPIAVLGILKTAGASKSLETKIAGESLFNDGIAVVVFLVIAAMATGTKPVTVETIFHIFATEVVGGVLYGLLLGGISFWMLKKVDNYSVEVLITLAITTGGYVLAESLHLSAPIAIVVAGLLIGNHGRKLAMSQSTREHLDTFWELIDEVLNAVLFVLIGLELVIITLDQKYLLAGLLAIPLVLSARMISVALPIGIMRRFRSFSPGVVSILTWGGLRGGISVALALSLPSGDIRNALVTITYMVVVFSVLVQGLTLAPLVRATASRAEAELGRTHLDT